MTRKFQMMTGAALSVLALAPAVTAHAQAGAGGNAIGEVVVTATHTGATNLQKTPIVVDVVSGGDLKKDNFETIKDLTQAVPSLVISQSNSNPQIYIRGIGGLQGLEGDVSLYMDGVYVARSSIIIETNFNDLDRIEVAEGPQGTLFGRNANGGAINYISKTPPDHFTFNNQLEIGNYALLDEAASIGGPVADNMQATLSISHVQHDGYLHNVLAGVGNPDAANRSAIRGQLRWEPRPDITNTVRADYLYTHENWATNDTFLSTNTANVSSTQFGINGLTFSDPLLLSTIGHLQNVDVNTVVPETELSYGLSDEFNWKINDNLTLKSISAGRTDHANVPQDNLTSFNYSGYGYSFYKEYQLSQEFNLINNFGPLSGVVGLYYFNEYSEQIGYSPTLGSSVKNPSPTAGTVTLQDTVQPTVSRAAFFQETYQITPTIGIVAGVRYTRDHKNLNTYNATEFLYPGTQIATGTFSPLSAPSKNPFIGDLNHDGDATTPKIGINWQATPDALLYASATAGYKSGGYSYTARYAVGAYFGPEHQWSYEVGAKTDWFDHTLRFDAAAFFSDWKGLQLTAVSNAGDANLYGLEMNLISKPTQIKGLTLTANVTLMGSRYVNFTDYTLSSILCPAGSSYCPTNTYPMAGINPAKISKDANGNLQYNATGNQLVNAPNVSLNLIGQKDFDLPGGADFYVRAEYAYTSLDYMDPTNAAISARAPTNIFNASIGYTPANSHWTVALWGRNLSNDIYLAGFSTGGNLTAPVSDPRTFGVRINYTY